ncbi:phospho-acceptor domain-containing protein [Desulfobotulus alkaliphilus]|uniref:histidine kinase n=1 Tax=Desulfobotulus alkaliphilus TaxID=622671 RepID=A0A562S7W3_9BACT|nr:ATP-binding protein [Desulfobotulus alkaliphilus]TWI76804.1 phospho-acceptor domain-containing protein [Desulfobotulus alkaliphilus]
MDILVAEDHPVSAKLLEKILLRAGHRVHLAADGEEAWDLLLKKDVRILLTDWMMPRLDGLSLCRRVRETLSGSYVYIILLTARDATEDLLSGFEAGADDYIAKPVNPDELMARIRVGLRHLAMEDRHEKTLRKLLNTEKMASLGHLAAGMAHEINNPLSFLASNIRTLGKYAKEVQAFFAAYQALAGAIEPKDTKTEQILQKMQALEASAEIAYILEDVPALVSESGEGIERIGNIVEDMRIFTHPGSLTPHMADIGQCITEGLSLAEKKHGKTAPVQKDLADLPPLFCYPGQLRQALFNICINALQSLNEGGEIHIRTCRSDNQHIVIQIRDTGCGIEPDLLPKIFDPFFTTRPAGRGTGLGLHVAYTLIQQHGGHIEVHSEPGKGSTFRIHLPTEGIKVQKISQHTPQKPQDLP